MSATENRGLKHPILYFLIALAFTSIVGGSTLYILGDYPWDSALIEIALVVGVISTVFVYISWGIASHLRASARKEAERKRIREHGLDAQVIVHSVQATNVSMDRNPQLSIDLTLVRQDAQKHRMTVLYFASFLVAPRIEPGAVYSAKVDPEDKTSIVVPAWEPNVLYPVEEASPRKF